MLGTARRILCFIARDSAIVGRTERNDLRRMYNVDTSTTPYLRTTNLPRTIRKCPTIDAHGTEAAPIFLR
jgi:hypothetical protein